MATKKYIVRAGFVVVLKIHKPDGSFVERTYDGGEEVTLEDADAEMHRHKLEFALQKDRDAALAAEQQALVASKAQQSPVELVVALTAALQQSIAAAQPQAAPAA